MSLLNEIKAIVRDHPIADPRGAMVAIDKLICEHKALPKIKPALKVTVVAEPGGFEVTLKRTGDDHDFLLATHALGTAIKQAITAAPCVNQAVKAGTEKALTSASVQG